MHNTSTRITLYVVATLIIACSVLDVISQPALWPLALGAIFLIGIELYAYHFPVIWYLYSHPYTKRYKHIKKPNH